jgi:hypothetical protein
MAKHKPWQGHGQSRAPIGAKAATPRKAPRQQVGMFQLPEIPGDTLPADPRDHYQGTWLSPVWALIFGPLYYLTHGFFREFFLLLITVPFGIGILISPFLARSAWERKAQDRADKVNLETLLRLMLEEQNG